MKWEELTARDFAKAIEESAGVCLIAAGCIEKHFDHLPLGTDYLNGHKICGLVAEKEPCVVFPPYYFGQINEARCFPGTVAISPDLALQLLGEVCDEIGRNGFTKIVIYNAHGGNTHLLNYFCQGCLSQRKSYAVFLPAGLHPQQRRDQWRDLCDTPIHGHACECETSISLANHEHLVRMEYVEDRKADPLGRLDHIPPGRVLGRWYSNYPDHYAGDARAADKQKGVKLRQLVVDSLADYIRIVKDDATALDLLDEFYNRCERIGQ